MVGLIESRDQKNKESCDAIVLGHNSECLSSSAGFDM